MKQDPPMPEELRNRFYPAFENGWYVAEIAGRTLMAVFAVISLLGYLGGYLGQLTEKTADGLLHIDYDPVIRSATPAHLTLHVSVPTGENTVTVTLPAKLNQSFGLQTITPRPSVWQAGPDWFQLTFQVDPHQHEVAIQMDGMPNTIGFSKLSARTPKGDSLSWSQLVVP